MDNQGQMGNITTNVMTVSDYILVPIEADEMSMKGVISVTQTIGTVKKMFNPKLAVMGMLFVKFDPRLIISKEVDRQLRQKFGPLVFRTTLPVSTKCRDAAIDKKPLSEIQPENSLAVAYRALTEELLLRLGNGKESQTPPAVASA
jgi:chromosome partitioning protein